ncbi:MAG: SDR family oxidoreductase [Rickettsiales bacterium]
MTDAFHGRTVLIPGGGRGIGYAAGAMMAKQGAKVALADVVGDRAQEAAARLKSETGAETLGIACDITSMDQVKKMVADTEAALGPVDVMVNTAAIVADKTFMESTPEDWKQMLDICLYGSMNVIHSVLPGMVERTYGRIVCLASDAARTGQARHSYYAAAKGGVISLVKSVAQEVGRNGVTLNVVSPGATDTELRQAREREVLASIGEERFKKREQTILRMYPTRRLGQPDDIAAGIVYLCGDGASWVTGQVLSINGGFAMV